MNSVNIFRLIDESPFTARHIAIICWCSLLLLFDGIELGMIGAIGPAVIQEWSLSPLEFGAISSYTAFGMIVGGLLFGPLADRYSRKMVIIISTLIYSVFTLLGAFSVGLTDFGIYRFIAGIGMGGIVPVILGLISEIMPKSRKNVALTIMTASIGVGTMFAALFATFIIPMFGWRVLFAIGALPILFLPFVFKYVPESPALLVRKNKIVEVVKVVENLTKRKIENVNNATFVYEIDGLVVGRGSLKKLLKGKWLFAIILLWLTFFCSYLVSFGLSAWIPNLMVEAGYPLTSSLLFAVSLNLGATIGALTAGKISERIPLGRLVTIFYIIGGISLGFLVFKIESALLLYVIFFIVGIGTTGAQHLLLAYGIQFYPTEVRATGGAVSNIMGRLGSFAGPLFGGLLVTLSFSAQMSFVSFGAIAILAAIFVLIIQFQRQTDTSVAISKTAQEIPEN